MISPLKTSLSVGFDSSFLLSERVGIIQIEASGPGPAVSEGAGLAGPEPSS